MKEKQVHEDTIGMTDPTATVSSPIHPALTLTAGRMTKMRQRIWKR
jgi:hypothetical protein